jgi:vacuolar-type H+-ATPase subunit I/STV1
MTNDELETLDKLEREAPGDFSVVPWKSKLGEGIGLEADDKDAELFVALHKHARELIDAAKNNDSFYKQGAFELQKENQTIRSELKTTYDKYRALHKTAGAKIEHYKEQLERARELSSKLLQSLSVVNGCPGCDSNMWTQCQNICPRKKLTTFLAETEEK